MSDEKLSDAVKEELKTFREALDKLSLHVGDKSRGDMHQLASLYGKVVSLQQTLLVKLENVQDALVVSRKRSEILQREREEYRSELGKLETQEQHDPIKDEVKPYALGEFIAIAKNELDTYSKVFDDANDFHKQTHTWQVWFRNFHEYMSW